MSAIPIRVFVICSADRSFVLWMLVPSLPLVVLFEIVSLSVGACVNSRVEVGLSMRGYVARVFA